MIKLKNRNARLRMARRMRLKVSDQVFLITWLNRATFFR
jgi:hypothetical protein